MKVNWLQIFSIILLISGVALAIVAYKAWEHKQNTNAHQIASASKQSSRVNLPDNLSGNTIKNSNQIFQFHFDDVNLNLTKEDITKLGFDCTKPDKLLSPSYEYCSFTFMNEGQEQPFISGGTGPVTNIELLERGLNPDEMKPSLTYSEKAYPDILKKYSIFNGQQITEIRLHFNNETLFHIEGYFPRTFSKSSLDNIINTLTSRYGKPDTFSSDQTSWNNKDNHEYLIISKDSFIITNQNKPDELNIERRYSRFVNASSDKLEDYMPR